MPTPTQADRSTSPPETAQPRWGATPVATSIKGVVYQVEVVRAGEPGYYKGLGERDRLPAGQGMLFLHTEEVPAPFWMKGMRFPLDILWIDSQGRIVHLERNIPAQPGVPDNQLRLYRPSAPARAVLEINAGEADARNFDVGEQVLFIYEQ